MEELACPEEQDYFWFPPVSVLKHAKRPERATEDGLLNSRGKTPVNMLYALLSRHIQVKGNSSQFRKVARGKFTLANRS
jgi:hypothetical protein